MVKELYGKMHAHPNFPNIYLQFDKGGITIQKSSGPNNLANELLKSCEIFKLIEVCDGSYEKKIPDKLDLPNFQLDVFSIIKKNPDINIIMDALKVLYLPQSERNLWIKEQESMAILPQVIHTTKNQVNVVESTAGYTSTHLTATSAAFTVDFNKDPINLVKDLCGKIHSHPNFPNIYLQFDGSIILIHKSSGPNNLPNELLNSCEILNFIAAKDNIHGKKIPDRISFECFQDDVCEIIKKNPDINILTGALEVLFLSEKQRNLWVSENE